MTFTGLIADLVRRVPIGLRRVPKTTDWYRKLPIGTENYRLVPKTTMCIILIRVHRVQLTGCMCVVSRVLSNKKKTVCYVGRTSIRYRVRWSLMGAYRVQKERRQQFNHLISLSPFSFSPFPLSLLLSNKKKTVCYVGRTSIRYRVRWSPMGAYRVQKERRQQFNYLII